MHVTAQQDNIVAINLALLIIPKASAQTFDVKSNRVVNVSRRGTGRGESGSEKILRIRRTATSKKRGLASAHPLSCDDRPGSWTTPSKQAFTRPFHPLLGVPRIGVFPFDLTPCSKSYSRRPTCPSSFHHCQPPPLPPRKILFLLPQKADTPPMRITELIRRMRYIIVSVFRNVEWSWRLYKFLTRTMRWSVKAGEAITGIEIIAPATSVRWKYYIISCCCISKNK